MLRRSTPAVEHCQKRASECEHLADLATDAQTKSDYLRLAAAWRQLAEQREFTDRMDSFLGYMKDD